MVTALMSLPLSHPIHADLARMSMTPWHRTAVAIATSERLNPLKTYLLSDVRALSGPGHSDTLRAQAMFFLSSAANAIFDAGLALREGARLIVIPEEHIQCVLADTPTPHPHTGSTVDLPAQKCVPVFWPRMIFSDVSQRPATAAAKSGKLRDSILKLGNKLYHIEIRKPFQTSKRKTKTGQKTATRRKYSPMPQEINLEAMSIQELDLLQERIAVARKKVLAARRRDALKAVNEAAAQYGFKLSELANVDEGMLGTAKKGRFQGEPKYRNPNDADQTWTGKGRQPQWFKEAVEAGTDRDEMLIAA